MTERGERTLTAGGRDRRTGGEWTALQRMKNDALWVLASTALLVAERLPLPVLRSLGHGLGAAAHALAATSRRTALANVARVFPELDARARRALVRRSFVALGRWLGEAPALLRRSDRPPPLPVLSEARTLLESARAEGRGVIFPSAHLGPWERVAASLVAAGVPLVTMARESYDPRFSVLYAKLRAAGGVRLVWRDGAGAAARILRTLRAGEVLGVPMDLSARVPSREVAFLGHAAPTAIGPARLALRTGAAVVVGTAAPGDGSELVVTATRIRTADLGDDEAGVLALTGRINAELSRRILALAHGWVWMHDRWPPRAEVR